MLLNDLYSRYYTLNTKVSLPSVYLPRFEFCTFDHVVYQDLFLEIGIFLQFVQSKPVPRLQASFLETCLG